jgi:hypothetical protein
MSFSLSDILKLIPKAQVEALVDGVIDQELAKLSVELKALVNGYLDKVLGQ